MNKEFKKYVTEELLLIANNVTGEYTDKQVQQAKLELYNQGVDDKIIAESERNESERYDTGFHHQRRTGGNQTV